MDDISMYIGLLFFTSFFIFQLIYIIVPVLKSKNYGIVFSKKETRMSILIPAYNEESVVENCLKGILNLNYSNYEAVFINDGSSDKTLETLNRLLDLKKINIKPSYRLVYEPVKNTYRSQKHRNIIVIDKLNGGKANSLNAGADYAKGEVLITLDADSILEKDSLNYINTSFHDEKIIAAGGMVHVGQMVNSTIPKYKGKLLLKYQLSEYMTSFYVRKLTQSYTNTIAIVSGAFGAFRKKVLYEIEGYKTTLGEDMEITLNIQRIMDKKYKENKLIFIPQAVCYTEVPENLRDLFKQRTRWQKGFMDCVNMYKKDFLTTFNKKFTIFLIWDSLMLGISGVLTVIMLPFIILSGQFKGLNLACFIVSYITQIMIRLLAFWVAGKFGYKYSKVDFLKIFIFTIIETVTFRLMDTFFFAYGTVSYMTSRNNHNWNKVKRLGNIEVKSN